LRQRARDGHALEERRVEVVARDEDLDEDEEGAERHGHEAVDERAVERRRLDEGGRGGTNDELLPELVLGRGDHELVELLGRVRHRDAIVQDVEVDEEGREQLAEVEAVRLLQELRGGGEENESDPSRARRAGAPSFENAP